MNEEADYFARRRERERERERGREREREKREREREERERESKREKKNPLSDRPTRKFRAAGITLSQFGLKKLHSYLSSLLFVCVYIKNLFCFSSYSRSFNLGGLSKMLCLKSIL